MECMFDDDVVVVLFVFLDGEVDEFEVFSYYFVFVVKVM